MQLSNKIRNRLLRRDRENRGYSRAQAKGEWGLRTIGPEWGGKISMSTQLVKDMDMGDG